MVMTLWGSVRSLLTTCCPCWFTRNGTCTDRLVREYREREAAEGPLSTEDLPPDAFRAVEQTTTADSRQFAAFAATISAAPDQVRMPCAAWNPSRPCSR